LDLIVLTNKGNVEVKKGITIETNDHYPFEAPKIKVPVILHKNTLLLKVGNNGVVLFDVSDHAPSFTIRQHMANLWCELQEGINNGVVETE